LAASMYGQKPQWIDALNREHNTFVFELDPGGLGKREFRDTPFAWDGSTLTEVREGTSSPRAWSRTRRCNPGKTPAS